MAYWLMKTEPDECSIDDFAASPATTIRWDGVRNYQARNFIRDMEIGDRVFIYHSSCKKIGIAGVVEVTTPAYPDPTQFNPESPYYDPKSTQDKPRWDAIDLRFVSKFDNVLSLDKLKNLTALSENPLIRMGNRLSVIPFTESEWRGVSNLIK
ncbi:EVE domain-containing protein [Aliidiomarina haloalkalitolerans]|uniref:EVE domain-containing protein n=1 Tax=Aliidiomarina haloalkalitolerans TaxID=859059 RepID=A0A432VVT0_9GAMM|nr:EVE domain-containing protein [Aliidiomarina haloalkalitolerans]RUO20692.1 EVE domain-containing protein [Aliidiomarina haloalkalitolerans]